MHAIKKKETIRMPHQCKWNSISSPGSSVFKGLHQAKRDILTFA